MRFFCCWLLLSLSSLPLAATAVTVLPYPAEYQQKEGYLDLRQGLRLELSHNTPLLQAAAARFSSRLRQQSHFVIPTSSTQYLSLELLASPAANPVPPADMLEQYQLKVSNTKIVLSAPSEFGIIRGLETLLQLVNNGKISALTLSDQPRFSWRGLLLDPARRFLPLSTLKRKIDIMASAKLNVLHLHLTDDQGWRFESKLYPRLQQIGGADGFYTQEELRQLVRYAAERGIRVVPEIDLPGHTTALGAAYPEYMSQPGPSQPETHWGVHPAVLDPTNEQLYPFLEQLLAEVTAVFPDRYLHIGGDEVVSDHWLATPHIVAFMQQQQLADTAALHAYFNQRLQQILQRLGRAMMGWDEVLDSKLDRSVLIQSWRGTESLYEAAAAGHKAILSTGYYLDQPQFASYHYRNDPLPPDIAAADLSQLTRWSAWQFSFARLRGNAIAGKLLLLHFADGSTKGAIAFNGRQAQVLHKLELNAQRLTFSVDSWMGPLFADLTLNTELSGQLVVGNAPYVITGQAIALQQAATTPLLFALPSRQIDEHIAGRILGGEITLWGELVTADNIDIRLWPNGFAVAERLWSNATVQDEQHLQQRMHLLMQQLTKTGSLQYTQQQAAGFNALAGDHAQRLAELAQVLEPAHYYHRLHQKSAANLYHQAAPLDQLVDFLPAENQQLQHFTKVVSHWLQHREEADRTWLHQQLQQWQEHALSLIQAADTPEHPGLQVYMAALKQISALCQSGQVLLNSIRSQTPLDSVRRQQIQLQLQQAATISQEMIIALHRPLQLLLDQAPHSEIWVAKNSFSAAIEGPAVDSSGNLYAVNFGEDGTIGKVTPNGDASLYLTLPKGSIGNGIVFAADGAMFIADYTGHNILRYQHGLLAVHAHNPAMNQPNDLAIMQNGVIFASDPNWENSSGQLWRIDTDGRSHLLVADMGTTNGIAVSPDQQFLYVNESVQRKIWRFTIHPDFSLSEPELFAQFSAYGLDGMRFDSKGNLYVARYGKGTVLKLDPAGQVVEEYRLNHPLPTNVSLKHDDSALYITIQQCGCIERIVF
ncbi:family 20 glycosylhydrolase [Alishewanella longhuensis]